MLFIQTMSEAMVILSHYIRSVSYRIGDREKSRRRRKILAFAHVQLVPQQIELSSSLFLNASVWLAEEHRLYVSIRTAARNFQHQQLDLDMFLQRAAFCFQSIGLSAEEKQ